ARENRFLVIDHRAVAPKLFNERSFHNAETNRPFHRSMRVSSGMATAVPGVVKAWEEAINNYGKMTLAHVLEPAIEIAQKGFIVDANLQRQIKENEARFKLFFSTKQIYFDKNGQPLQEGDIIKNPDFAKT